MKSLQNKNSSFFEDMKIQFNEKMNCIMGGERNGKSAVSIFFKISIIRLISANNDIFKKII